MSSTTIRFFGSLKSEYDRHLQKPVVSLLGIVAAGERPRVVTLKLSHRKPAILALNSLSSAERQIMCLVSIEVSNGHELIQSFTPDSIGATCLAETISFPGLTTASATLSSCDAHYVVTFESLESWASTTPSSARPLSCFSFTENDVVFIFPNEAFEDPYLWASVANLSEASSYWNALFNSEYSEATQQLTTTSIWDKGWKSDLEAILKTSRDDPDGDGDREDSGIQEIKKAREERRMLGAHLYLDPSRSVAQQIPIRYVIVKDMPIRVYQAVFTWLLTGNIEFAKLPSPSSQTQSDPAAVLCSPIAIYRLTHLLEISTLMKLAISNYESQLTVQNALAELFSEPSYTYSALREVAMAAAVKNWAAIKAAGGLVTVKRAVARGEADAVEVSRVALELLERV